MKMTEGVLSFDFETENGSLASKYDEWSFYRKHFCKIADGIKAVDFIYIDRAQRCTWLIEVKDYRHPQTELIKPSELADAVALKVRDTLAGLVAAKYNANDVNEKQFSQHALEMSEIRVVLHLEQVLAKRYIEPADILTKLKQKLKAIDVHLKVVNKDNLKSDMRWVVS